MVSCWHSERQEPSKRVPRTSCLVPPTIVGHTQQRYHGTPKPIIDCQIGWSIDRSIGVGKTHLVDRALAFRKHTQQTDTVCKGLMWCSWSCINYPFSSLWMEYRQQQCTVSYRPIDQAFTGIRFRGPRGVVPCRGFVEYLRRDLYTVVKIEAILLRVGPFMIMNKQSTPSCSPLLVDEVNPKQKRGKKQENMIHPQRLYTSYQTNNACQVLHNRSGARHKRSWCPDKYTWYTYIYIILPSSRSQDEQFSYNTKKNNRGTG